MKTWRTRLRRRMLRGRDVVRCFYCHKVVSAGEATIDHLIPLSRGGERFESNAVIACRWCNSHKSDMEYGEFLASKVYASRVRSIAA